LKAHARKHHDCVEVKDHCLRKKTKLPQAVSCKGHLAGRCRKDALKFVKTRQRDDRKDTGPPLGPKKKQNSAFRGRTMTDRNRNSGEERSNRKFHRWRNGEVPVEGFTPGEDYWGKKPGLCSRKRAAMDGGNPSDCQQKQDLAWIAVFGGA